MRLWPQSQNPPCSLRSRGFCRTLLRGIASLTYEIKRTPQGGLRFSWENRLDGKLSAFRLQFISLQGERGIRLHAHFVSLAALRVAALAAISKPAVFAALSRVLSNPLRGFASLTYEIKRTPQGGSFYFKEREGLDKAFTSFLALPFGLRLCRNPKLACVRFALGKFVEPSARVLIPSL